jgi:hypothetical protein
VPTTFVAEIATFSGKNLLFFVATSVLKLKEFCRFRAYADDLQLCNTTDVQNLQQCYDKVMLCRYGHGLERKGPATVDQRNFLFKAMHTQHLTRFLTKNQQPKPWDTFSYMWPNPRIPVLI